MYSILFELIGTLSLRVGAPEISIVVIIYYDCDAL